MSFILRIITECLTGADSTPLPYDFPEEKTCQIAATPNLRTAEELASDLVNVLKNAEKGGDDLTHQLDDTIGTYGWTEYLAACFLAKLTELLRSTAKKLGPVLEEAFRKAVDAARQIEGFAAEHPVFVTVIALGILVLLAPWAIEALGFGESGPLAGSWAAAWQTRYAGLVPKGSLFSYLQRMGMKYHR